MTARTLLAVAGGACMSAGALLVALSVRDAPERAADGPERIGIAFYAQNHRFVEPPLLRAAAEGIALRVAPRWVQRGVFVTDRAPQSCASGARPLHVFALPAGGRTYYAVGFILDARRDAVACAVPLRRAPAVDYHPAAFAAVDALVRRGKLEYAAHPALRGNARAEYPPHDRAMLPVAFQ